MKNNYTLFYSINNTKKEDNFIVELSELKLKEKILKKVLGEAKFSPRNGIVDNILKFAKKLK